MQLSLKPTSSARAIWPDALTGCGLDSNFAYQLDDAGKNVALQSALDEVFLIASSISQSPEYRFEPRINHCHFHRPKTLDRAGRDVVIWSSPDKLSNDQYQKVQEAAISGRYENVVVVVSRGAGGVAPTFSRVTPDAMTDVSEGPPPTDPEDIAELPPPPLFWMPSGELQTLLASDEWTQLPEGSQLTKIGLAVQSLFDRTVL